MSILTLFFLSLISCHPPGGANPAVTSLKILVVTGGHDFDPSFFTLFETMEEVRFDTVSQPAANRLLSADLCAKYNAVVFYDMVQEISEDQKEAFREMTRCGIGMVFLHHSLVSYQNWDFFHELVGGRYFERGYPSPHELSTYKHDLDLDIHVYDAGHPVTRGITDFTIHDEGYGNILVNEGVHVLLSTSHPDCAEKIAWTSHCGHSDIVYLMLGHDANAYRNESFRKLVQNAIFWVSGRSR